MFWSSVTSPRTIADISEHLRTLLVSPATADSPPQGSLCIVHKHTVSYSISATAHRLNGVSTGMDLANTPKRHCSGAQHGEANIPNGVSDAFVPHEVLQKVAASASKDVAASMRLTSKDFARAVDETVSSLRVASWGSKPISKASRLHNVSRVIVTTAPNWPQVSRLVAQLPSLNTLSIPHTVNARMKGTMTPRLTALTRLDLGTGCSHMLVAPVPKAGNLTALKVASFSISMPAATHMYHSGFSGSCASKGLCIGEVARFAPNLEQLYCNHSHIESAAAQLPFCTHFGGRLLSSSVDQDGHSNQLAATAAALRAVCPKLQVLSRVPQITSPDLFPFGVMVDLSVQFLQHLPGVEVACCPDGFALRTLVVDSQVTALQQLRTVRIHMSWRRVGELTGICKLLSLEHLQLLLEAPTERPGSPRGWVHDMAPWQPSRVRELALQYGAVLTEIAELSKLKSVALPAAVLCTSCLFGASVDGTASQHSVVIEMGLFRLASKPGLQLTFVGMQRREPCGIVYSTSHWPNGGFGYAIQLQGPWPGLPMYGPQPVASGQDCPKVVEEHTSHQVEVSQMLDRVLDRTHRQQSDTTVAGCSVALRLGLECAEAPCMDNHSGKGWWGFYGPADLA